MNSGIDRPACNCTAFVVMTHLRIDSGRSIDIGRLRSRDWRLRIGRNQVHGRPKSGTKLIGRNRKSSAQQHNDYAELRHTSPK